MKSVRSIREVAERQLCTGCGVCAYIDPSIRMVDDLYHGRRPLAQEGDGLGEAIEVCPGAGLGHPRESRPGAIASLAPAWGPVLQVYEGFAADQTVRHLASSGGAATALALYALERAGMHGVLHIRARPDVRYLNQTVLSRSRDELLAATGSRYAPASPCDGLGQIEDAPAPCVFIGKPCDVAGAVAAAGIRPDLDRRLGLTIAIFCAGTPSTRGTLTLLRDLGVDDPSELEEVRYRGRGWPGHFRARTPDREVTTTYAHSWGTLQRHRQWRCYVCADHTGEFADVAVGDPWYREIPEGEPGRSLVLARTPRGKALVEAAMADGYLVLEGVDPALVAASQPELLKTRGAIWGRIHVSRLFGAAAPRYTHMPMARFWWSHLSLREKLRSVLGTAKRVFTRRLRQRIPVRPWNYERASGSGEEERTP